MPDFTPKVPDWAQNFANEGIHCFFNTKERKWTKQGYPFGEECTEWREHWTRRGKSQWMRFIHAFGEQVDREDNPFVADKDDEPKRRFMFIDSHGGLTSDGRRTFSENYFRNESDWGLRIKMRVFLANDSKWARIECFDPELVRACEQAWAAVEQSYIDEEENT